MPPNDFDELVADIDAVMASSTNIEQKSDSAKDKFDQKLGNRNVVFSRDMQVLRDADTRMVQKTLELKSNVASHASLAYLKDVHNLPANSAPNQSISVDVHADTLYNIPEDSRYSFTAMDVGENEDYIFSYIPDTVEEDAIAANVYISFTNFTYSFNVILPRNTFVVVSKRENVFTNRIEKAKNHVSKTTRQYSGARVGPLVGNITNTAESAVGKDTNVFIQKRDGEEEITIVRESGQPEIEYRIDTPISISMNKHNVSVIGLKEDEDKGVRQYAGLSNYANTNFNTNVDLRAKVFAPIALTTFNDGSRFFYAYLTEDGSIHACPHDNDYTDYEDIPGSINNAFRQSISEKRIGLPVISNHFWDNSKGPYELVNNDNKDLGTSDESANLQPKVHVHHFDTIVHKGRQILLAVMSRKNNNNKFQLKVTLSYIRKDARLLETVTVYKGAGINNGDHWIDIDSPYKDSGSGPEQSDSFHNEWAVLQHPEGVALIGAYNRNYDPDANFNSLTDTPYTSKRGFVTPPQFDSGTYNTHVDLYNVIYNLNITDFVRIVEEDKSQLMSQTESEVYYGGISKVDINLSGAGLYDYWSLYGLDIVKSIKTQEGNTWYMSGISNFSKNAIRIVRLQYVEGGTFKLTPAKVFNGVASLYDTLPYAPTAGLERTYLIEDNGSCNIAASYIPDIPCSPYGKAIITKWNTITDAQKYLLPGFVIGGDIYTQTFGDYKFTQERANTNIEYKPSASEDTKFRPIDNLSISDYAIPYGPMRRRIINGKVRLTGRAMMRSITLGSPQDTWRTANRYESVPYIMQGEHRCKNSQIRNMVNNANAYNFTTDVICVGGDQVRWYSLGRDFASAKFDEPTTGTYFESDIMVRIENDFN